MSARFPNESEAVRSKQTRFREERSSDLEDVTFLRLPEVKAVAGLSKTSLYTLIRDRNSGAVQDSSGKYWIGCPPGIRTPIGRVRVGSPTIERGGNR
jgi:hypothetical protein